MGTFDFISEVLTSKELAEWLKAPLERGAAKGNTNIAITLVEAGAAAVDALVDAISKQAPRMTPRQTRVDETHFVERRCTRSMSSSKSSRKRRAVGGVAESSV